MASNPQLAFAIRAVNEAKSALKDTANGVQEVADKAKAAKAPLDDAAEASGGLRSKLGALALAATGAVTAFASWQTLKAGIGIASELGGEVSKLKRETGLSAEEASKLIFAFDRFGVSGDQASGALGILAKKLQGVTDEETGAVGPGGKVVDVLKSLGIEAIGADGALRPMGELLPDISDVFKKMPAGPEKTALAMNLFGKSGKDLIPILNQGSEGLKALGVDAEKFGLVLDDQRLNKIKQYKESQKDLKATLEGVKLEIGLAVMPVMTAFTGVMVEGTLKAKGYAMEGIAVLKHEAEKLTPTIELVKDRLLETGKAIEEKVRPPVEDLANFLAGAALAAWTAVGNYIVNDFLPAAADFATAVGTTAYDAAKKFADFLTDHVLPPLTTAAGVIKDTLQPAIDAVTKTVKDNAVPAFNAFGISLGAMAASVAGIDLTINILGNTIGALGAIIASVSILPAFALWLIPLAAVIAALVVLEMKTHFFSETLWPALKDVADVLNREVVPVLKDAADIAGGQLKDAGVQLTQTWAGMQPVLSEVGRILKDDILPVAKDVLQWFRDNPEAIAALTGALTGLLILLFPIPAAIIAVTAAGTLLLANWDAIRDKAGELYDTIVEKVSGIIATVQGIPVIGEIFTMTMNLIQDVVGTAFEFIKTDIETRITAIKDIINIVMALLHGDWSEAWDGMKTLVTDVLGGLTTEVEILIKGVMTVIVDTVKGQYAAVRDGFLFVLDKLGILALAFGKFGYDIAVDILEGVYNGTIGKVGEYANKVAGAIKSAMDSALHGFGLLGSAAPLGIEVGKDIIEGIGAGLDDAGGILQDRIEKLKITLVGISDPAMRAKIIAEIKEMMAKLTEILSQPLPTPVPGGAGGGGGGAPPGGTTGGGMPLPGEQGTDPLKDKLSQLVAAQFSTQEINALSAAATHMGYSKTAQMKVMQLISSIAGQFSTGGALSNAIMLSWSYMNSMARSALIRHLRTDYGALLPKGFDQGGWLMPGLTLAVNNTGRPERVLAGGGDVHVHIHGGIFTGDERQVIQLAERLARVTQRRLQTSGGVGLVGA